MTFYQNVNLLKWFELRQKVIIKNITANFFYYDSLYGYRYIKREELKLNEYDFIIVMSDKYYAEIEKEILKMGYEKEKIISWRVLLIPNINLKRYMELKKNDISIFSMNCWGGITYHQLGLQFCSPFINMFILEKDYITFLKQPDYYMQQNIIFDHWNYNEKLEMNYPVCKCGDICLFFNHYSSFEEAEECWYKRRERINWKNIFVMFYTNSRELAYEFDILNYEKKICFTMDEFDIKSCYSLGRYNECKYLLSQIVSNMAWGIFPTYNPIELLLTGNVVLEI